MLDRLRFAVTRFLVKYGTDWEKDHAERMVAIAELGKTVPIGERHKEMETVAQ